MDFIGRCLNSYRFYIIVSIMVLMSLTTLTSVGFGALNQSLQIAGDVEYEEDIGNVIRAYSYDDYEVDFHSSTYRYNIISIDFLSNKTIPANAVASWDVSADTNSGRVMAWIINDPNNSGYYKAYIGADGGVIANPNSSLLFNDFFELREINFNNNFDTSQVTDMSYMFASTGITGGLDLSSLDTSQVTDMSYMFGSCDDFHFLMNETLDCSSFNTSNVTNMSGMFDGLAYVAEIIVDGFDTSNVTDMSYMFYGCYKLTTIDVSDFVTDKVTNMSGMFGSLNLTSLDITHFNTSNVTDMGYMFSGLNFSIDLSNFDTSNVTSMRYMFSYYRGTELNIQSFNTSKVTDMSYMFHFSQSLTTIRISSLWNVSNVTSSSGMFHTCPNLPNYNSSYTNVSMAKPTTQGGYLTLV